MAEKRRKTENNERKVLCNKVIRCGKVSKEDSSLDGSRRKLMMYPQAGFNQWNKKMQEVGKGC